MLGYVKVGGRPAASRSGADALQFVNGQGPPSLFPLVTPTLDI